MWFVYNTVSYIAQYRVLHSTVFTLDSNNVQKRFFLVAQWQLKNCPYVQKIKIIIILKHSTPTFTCHLLLTELLAILEDAAVNFGRDVRPGSKIIHDSKSNF